MSLNAIMSAHPSIQDLSSEAKFVCHHTSPLAIVGYRLQITLLAPIGRMGSRHDGIRSSPRCIDIKIHWQICRKRLRHSYSDAGFALKTFWISQTYVYIISEILRKIKFSNDEMRNFQIFPIAQICVKQVRPLRINRFPSCAHWIRTP